MKAKFSVASGFVFGLGTAICLTNVGAQASTIPPKMKAVVVHAYGGPEQLRLDDAPVPRPKENEVLVRVSACGVNPADPLIVSGKYAEEFGTHLPLIPGYDVAGTVVQVGAKATRLKVGDEVYAFSLWGGGWAQYCAFDESNGALKPKSLSFTQAAAVPLGALTAWQGLVDAAHLTPRQTVLIQGGSGGVGSFAVQIAKARGAKVFATASTKNQDLLKELGADQAIGYTTEKFEEKVKELDVVFDTIGRETLARSYGVLRKGGMLVSIAGRPDPDEVRKHEINGIFLASHPDAAALAEIAKLIDAGKIKPVVTEVLPMSDAAKCERAGRDSSHSRENRARNAGGSGGIIPALSPTPPRGAELGSC